MPLFLDIHDQLPEGATAHDVQNAHAADVKIQSEHGVTYQRYWVDESTGKAFCLVEAPSAEAATTVHREAHGLLATHIYQVTEGA
jgi:hypothetical protein